MDIFKILFFQQHSVMCSRSILNKFNILNISANFCLNFSTRNFSSRKCIITKKTVSADAKMTDPRMKELMQDYVLTDYQYQQVYDLFTDQISRGLKKMTVAKADTKCYITYVHQVPTGQEVGKYLALDLGGTNFRVLLLFLKGENEEVEMSSEVFSLTNEIITGDGAKLFDYIAKCLHKFTKEHKVEHDKLPIGFTFSFPCFQASLETAKLIRWTKGFSAPGVVGEDVGRLLREAIARETDMKVGQIAILNDTTGTLMSCAHKNPDCKIGLIIGTGCNACYLERMENTDKVEKAPNSKHSHIVINIEWGAFGDGGCLDFLKTDFDKEIDAPTPNRGQQIYEKFISGMYLGGLVRLNLQKAIKMGLMFDKHKQKDRILDKIAKDRECFPTNLLSELESDKSEDFTAACRIFKGLGIDDASPEDCKKLLYICDVISERAARLAAVGLSSLVNRINEPYTIVGIDGSVYRFHPKFDKLIRRQMDAMVKLEIDYDLMLSEDGSGRGAALVAAVTAK